MWLLAPPTSQPAHSNCFLQDYFFVIKSNGICRLFLFIIITTLFCHYSALTSLSSHPLPGFCDTVFHCLSGYLFRVFSKDCSSSNAYYMLPFHRKPSPGFVSLDMSPYMTTLPTWCQPRLMQMILGSVCWLADVCSQDPMDLTGLSKLEIQHWIFCLLFHLYLLCSVNSTSIPPTQILYLIPDPSVSPSMSSYYICLNIFKPATFISFIPEISHLLLALPIWFDLII